MGHVGDTAGIPEPTLPRIGGFRTPVREPEVAELRAFCAAATMGSIAAAARSLNVSQPALSKRLRALEAVAGMQLFQRSTRGVTLTAAGVRLYGAARRLLVSADSVSALMTHAPTVAPVRMAVTPVIAELRLPGVLAELAQFEPPLAVEVMVGNSSFVRELVRDGRSDLGIAAVDPDRPPDDSLRGKVIWRDEVVIGVPPGHPWVDYEEVPPEVFAQTEVVEPDPSASGSRLVGAAFESAGLRRVPPYASLGSPAAVVQTAIASGRPALLSGLAGREPAAGGLAVRRIAGMRFDREFAILWAGSVTDLSAPVQGVAQYLLDLPFARSRRASREFRDA